MLITHKLIIYLIFTTMRKKKLTSVSDIPTFYSFRRSVMFGYKGYSYTLSGTPTTEQKQELTDKYNNIVWLDSHKEFAPEIKSTILFVADKVIKD